MGGAASGITSLPRYGDSQKRAPSSGSGALQDTAGLELVSVIEASCAGSTRRKMSNF